MVRPAARLEALGWPSTLEVFRADLRTSRELPRAFDGVDVLLHVAAVVSGEEDAQFAGTVVATERLLDAMAQSACQTAPRPGFIWERDHGYPAALGQQFGRHHRDRPADADPDDACRELRRRLRPRGGGPSCPGPDI